MLLSLSGFLLPTVPPLDDTKHCVYAGPSSLGYASYGCMEWFWGAVDFGSDSAEAIIGSGLVRRVVNATMDLQSFRKHWPEEGGQKARVYVRVTPRKIHETAWTSPWGR